MRSMHQKINSKSGFTIIEISVGLLLIGIIAALIAAIYSAQFRLFLTQITGISIASNSKVAVSELTAQTRQAESIVTTCPGCPPSDVTGPSIVVYRLWTLDANGNPIDSTYDYIVFRQQSTNTANLIRETFKDPLSSRTGGDKVIATNLAPTGLNFTYNNADPTLATQVTFTVTTQKTESGKTQTITNSGSVKLRNKPNP